VRKENVVAASTTSVAILLAFALAGMVNWLGFRHYARADWTKSQIYSLSDKTLNVLKGVTGDVKVIVFMTPSTPLFAETKELLARYQAKTPKLSVEYIDPERDPLQAELFEDPPKIANGMLTLKEQPGLGLTLSEKALQKFGEKIL